MGDDPYKYRYDDETYETPEAFQHVHDMTRFGLHSKSEIASELAGRDRRIADLECRLQKQHELYTNAVNELSQASTWHDYVGQPLDPNVEREWRWHNGVTWRYLVATFPANAVTATKVQYRPIVIADSR